MSNYLDFVSDFPRRCSDLLIGHELEATLQGREVTLMLAIASSGFNIPFERLRPPAKENPAHPSGDRDKYPEARKKLDLLLAADSFFLCSELCDGRPGSWLAGKVKDVGDSPDYWRELSTRPKRMTNKKTVKTVLCTVRNALAHGNIYTRGSDSQIEQIVLVSRPIDAAEYNFIAVSPRDFRAFLLRWFKFVESLEMPGKVVEEVLVYAL